MRGVSWVAGGLLAGLACAGCYESRLSSGVPPGLGGTLDGSASVVFDAGLSPDAGLVRDAGTPPDAARRDAGLACTDPIPAYAGPSCRLATVQCLGTCDGADACAGCYDADPDCLVCIYHSVGQCVNALGCRDEWAALACCAERTGTCRDLEVSTLLFECGGACPSELQAWGDCLNGALERGQCLDAPNMPCLP